MEEELVIMILVDDYIITIYNTDDIYITIN